MDFFFFLIFILVFVVPGLLKSAKKKQAANRFQSSGSGNDDHKSYDTNEDLSHSNSHSTFDTAEFRELKERVKFVASKRGATLGRKQVLEAARRREREKSYSNEDTGDETIHKMSRDAFDSNRSRREDWGVRAGPGILSSRNLLILFTILIILTVLGLIPV